MAIYSIDGRPRNGKTYYVISQVPLWLKQNKRIYSNIKLFPDKIIKKGFWFGQKKEYWSNDIAGQITNKSDRDNPQKKILYWRNIDEWNYMSNGVIIADEGQRYFNARMWSLLSEDTEIKLQQHGKENLDIFLTVQHYSRLDVTLRLLVERFFHIEMDGGKPDNIKRWFGLPKHISIKEYYLEDMIRAEQLGYRIPDEDIDGNKTVFGVEPISRTGKYIRKSIFAMYDTYEQVGRSRSMPIIKKCFVHTRYFCPDCELKQVHV